MQTLLCALSLALVFIGIITNMFPQTSVNAGTMVVDALYAAIAVVAVFGPLRKEGFRALRTPLVIFAVFAVWCLGLAAFGDGVLSQRVMGFRNNIVYPGIWLLVGLSAREIGLRRLRETIWYSGLVICAFAIVQAMFHHDLPDCVMLLGHGEDRFGFEGQDIFRPTGLVGNTIVFSGFSAIVLLIGWMRPERKKSLLQKLLTLIPATALFLTYTRTANVAILVVWGFAWSFFGMKSWRGSLLRAGVVIFTLWVLIGGEAGNTPQAVFAKYIKSFFPEKAAFVIDRMSSQDNSSIGSTERHLLLFKKGWRLVRQHPVCGVGLGSQGYSSKAPDDICVMRDGYWMATVLELGIPGAVVWLAFFTWMFFSLMRKANADADEDDETARSLAASLMLVLAYFGMTSILNSSYSARTNQCLLWMCVGALLSDRFVMRVKNGVPRLKFVLNGAFVRRHATGLERFAGETIRALDALAAPGEFVLLVPRSSENPLLDELKNIAVRRYGLASGFAWEQFCLPFFAWSHNAETVNLCNVAPLANPGAVCIHDIFYKTRARDFRGSVRGRLSSIWHRLQYSWCTRFAHRLLTVSRYSAQEISREYGVPAERIVVLGNGWEHVRRIMGDDGALAKLPSGGRFFLVLGSLAPNKNMEWVCRSAKRHPDVTYAVAGGAFASAGRTGCGDAPANMVFLGRVSDGEMKSLMERCEALVFPSLEEGFGIPPLEALALGRPVVAARKSCLPEIYGDAVHWFDPDDPDACDDPRELIKSPVSPADEVLTRHVWRNVASGLLSALRGNDVFARAKIWYNMQHMNVSGMKFSRQFLLKRDQILVLIAKDFKLKYNSTALGFLWSLLVPTLTSIVYYFVFGVMMRFDTPNYLLYLMSGTFLWQFFANVIMMNGSVLMSNQGLLKKTSFDRELLVRGTFYTESIHFLLTIPVLLVMMICYDVMPSLLLVVPNLLVLILALMLLSIGVSYFYAACNLYFRDLERIMNIFMMMWMFCSPVFIPVSSVPEEYLWIYNVNPMASILQIWRDIFYVPGWHPQLFLPLIAACAVTFYIGRLVFKKMEPGFAEMM